jgi:hypothetical protein
MRNVLETFWINDFLLQILRFFTPKGGGLMVQPLWDFWISKSCGCCVVHFSNKTLNFNYVKKNILALVLVLLLLLFSILVPHLNGTYHPIQNSVFGKRNIQFQF